MSKYLVVGQGSMGKRRVRCLLGAGVEASEIAVFDTREDRLQESREKYGVNTTTDFAAALAEADLRAVLVSVPGFLHMQYCLAAARAGKHWFCEVPLSTKLDGIAELKTETRRQNLIGAPGCQLLFHELGIALKEWATGPLGGRVLSGYHAFGSWLPEWHSYEDYRKFYASNKAMGGGNLDVIAQELTWLHWIIDDAFRAVSCRTSKTSDLELAAGSPDHQEIILEFENDLMLSMHFDILDRVHDRMTRLITDASTLAWSTQEMILRIFEGTTKEWHHVAPSEGYVYETCYHAEIAHFLHCIESGEAWPVPLETAEQVVQVLVAMDISDQQRRTVDLSELSGVNV